YFWRRDDLRSGGQRQAQEPTLMWCSLINLPLYSQPPATPNDALPPQVLSVDALPHVGFSFLCSQRGCDRHQLSSCRLYKTVRRLIDRSITTLWGRSTLNAGSAIRKPGFPVYRDDLKWISAGFLILAGFTISFIKLRQVLKIFNQS
ncbi:hypothetical protein RRG08_058432, partial [Elysia crispata]